MPVLNGKDKVDLQKDKDKVDLQKDKDKVDLQKDKDKVDLQKDKDKVDLQKDKDKVDLHRLSICESQSGSHFLHPAEKINFLCRMKKVAPALALADTQPM